MPPRCLEKGQLSSRIMREVLQSGGRAGDGRTCREGGMWGEHAGGAISRTTWPHASKARGHITPGGRRPDPTHNPRYPVHTTRTPPRAAWRRGAAGDAHSLVAATHAHGEASALHPRRDHPLRASLRKLGGDACLAAPLVCGHAAARCGLHVRGGWCLQASLPARSAGRAMGEACCLRRALAPLSHRAAACGWAAALRPRACLLSTASRSSARLQPHGSGTGSAGDAKRGAALRPRACLLRRASRLRRAANTRLATSLVTSRQGIRARPPRPRLCETNGASRTSP